MDSIRLGQGRVPEAEEIRNVGSSQELNVRGGSV